MELLVLFVMVAGATTAYVVWLWLSDPGKVARRALRRLPNVPIGKVDGGARVKVTGVISARDPLIASPIDGEACVGYRMVAVALYGHTPRGGGAPQSRTGGETLDLSQCARFSIEDETGTALVEGPFQLGIDLEGGWSVPVTDFEPLRRAGSAAYEVSGAWAYSYQLGLLKPGDRVSLVGRVSRQLDPAGAAIGMRAPAEIIALHGSSQEPVLVAGAGKQGRR